jgi:hypothetical protein
MGIGLLVCGVVLLLIGIIALVNGIPNLRRRRRIIATPTSAIAQAPGTGPVEVKGRIAASEQGLVVAPFSARQGVWIRVIVQERRSRGKSSYWATVVNEMDSRHFFVDDGSGQMARVVPPGANVILESQAVANSGTFRDAPPHLEAFLNARGLKSTSWLGMNKQMRYEEQILAPGDNLYAIGQSRRQAGPPVSDGYRMVPGTQLVMYAAPGAEGELILTNKTEEELVKRLRWGFVGGVICAGLAVLLGVAGAAIQILDLAD